MPPRRKSRKLLPVLAVPVVILLILAVWYMIPKETQAGHIEIRTRVYEIVLEAQLAALQQEKAAADDKDVPF